MIDNYLGERINNYKYSHNNYNPLNYNYSKHTNNLISKNNISPSHNRKNHILHINLYNKNKNTTNY